MCLKLGIDDVLGWLDRVDRSVLDFWIAFDAIEPIGDEWQQVAELKRLLAQLSAFQSAACGVVLAIPETDELMPDRYRPAPVKRKPAPIAKTPEEQKAEAAAIARAMGFKIP